MDPRIKKSVKIIDGFFASYFSSQISPYFVWLFAKLKIKPNFVTMLSFLTAMAAIPFLIQGRLILTAVLIQLSFMLDCADGQLARYLNQKSKFGAWLDTITDRAKEFIVLFSISLVYYLKTQNYRIFILYFFAILVLALRHYDSDKRRELGVCPDRTKEKSIELKKIAHFRAILKESLLFGISERWALITLGLLFNQIILMFYVLIIFNVIITVIKSAYSWRKFANKST
jgi:phosphatidylglycerophosphate synthase